MITPDQSVVYTTYSQFCAKVRRIAVPDGVAERLKPAFDNYLVNAIIKAQRYIDCLRNIHVSFYDHSQQNVHCGVSEIIPPRGKINLVYAFLPGDQCVKHYYTPVSPHRIACWSQESDRICSHDDIPPGVGTEIWNDGGAICYAYWDLYGVLEDDTCWKCEPKYCARGQNGQLWLAPRPPCGYLVGVHWEGLKRRWTAADAIPDDDDLIGWVAQDVSKELALKHDLDPQMAAAHKVEADTKFADLMYWCDEEKLIQFELDCAQGIDTGNLGQMFMPIYPYPYEEVRIDSPPFNEEEPYDPGEPEEPEPYPAFSFYDSFESYTVGATPTSGGTGWAADWVFHDTDDYTIVAMETFDYTASENLTGKTADLGLGAWS